MSTHFKNLLQAKKNELNVQAAENIAELNTYKNTTEILDKWYFKNCMTKAAQRKQWDTATLIDYVTKRINQENENKVKKAEHRLETISKANRKVNSISISVEWTKSRTWGMCPKADIRVCFDDNTCDIYNSSRITGCGYDKESTAIAEALNQCNELLHALYSLKDANINKQNRDLFGYGSGYGINPYFEGGVGVSCYPAIFKSIGLKWEGISHGKTYDVYAVKKVN